MTGRIASGISRNTVIGLTKRALLLGLCWLLVSILILGIIRQVGAGENICTRTDSLTSSIGAPNIALQNIGPQGPSYFETSEYLIGNVAFSVIPLESNGAIDPKTETWNDVFGEITVVRTEIIQALSWWSSQNPNASVSFRGAPRPGVAWRVVQPVPISYEPINRPSTDEGLWIGEAMTYLGFPGTDYYSQTVAYCNWLRSSFGPEWGSEADWAFTIFMIDSSNETANGGDGCFTDGEFAYAYLGGPFIVMTYTNDGYGPDDLARTAAHEIGHIFYATDENDGMTENSGYLNVDDVEGFNGVMYGEGAFEWNISPGTWGQVGWCDSDSEGIQDIVDTFPNTLLNPYSPDPTNNATLTYTGTVAEVPYANENPYGMGRDITINRIVNVEFRIDDGPWMNATPADGTFNETEESFFFTTPPISPSTHTIETRGTNSVGNIETTYAADTVTVEGQDIAVASVTPFQTVVAQGYDLNINVTIANQGTYTETFSVTTYANTTEIETQEITLSSGNFTTIKVTWNTIGFDKGNYTIWAYAQPLQEEADITDNTLIYGDITVAIPGDIDGDSIVDIFDAIKLAGAYNSVPDSPNWNPNADLNSDGIIDIYDAIILAMNYNQSLP